VLKTCIIRAAAVALAISSASNAQAQSGQCSQALISDVGRIDLRSIEGLARAELHRRSLSENSNWAAGLNVVVDGVSLGADFSQAEQTRESYFSQSSLDWTSDRLKSVATQTLSQNSVAAYRACLEGRHRSGPRILVHDATRDQVTISVLWQSPPGASPTTEAVDVSISGGAFRGQFPDQWTTGASHAVITDRTPGTDMRVVANIGAESDAAFISRLPEPPAAGIRPQCKVEAIAVRDQACSAGFQYVGPIDARAHGGHCVRLNGCAFTVQAVRTRTCASGAYIGPNDADAHGGHCLQIEDPHYRVAVRQSNAPCPPGTTYLGPIDQKVHGGTCLNLAAN
jgi:hypothetical protein